MAVRKNDLRAMKLLLDFKANPDALVIDDTLPQHNMRKRSLLSIAVYNGSAEAAKMLLDAGANPHPEGMPPLIAALNNETRESLAVLLKGRSRDILSEFENKPFIVHAIEYKSNLLPIIVSLVKEEIEKMKEAGEENIPPFPPKGLKSKHKSKLEKADALHDTLITSEFVDNAVKVIKCPWRCIESPQENNFSSDGYSNEDIEE